MKWPRLTAATKRGFLCLAILLGFTETSAAGNIAAGFWFVAAATLASGFIEWRIGEETHPRLNLA